MSSNEGRKTGKLLDISMTDKKMTRRNFLRLSSLATAGAALASCVPNASPATSPPTNPISATSTPMVSISATNTSTVTVSATSTEAATMTVSVPTTASVQPSEILGTARGIFPGRVVWVHNPSATNWDGQTGQWWDDKNTDQEVVKEMVSQAIQQQTGKSDDQSAWDALFRFYNSDHGKIDTGYTPGEKVAIKVNLNVISEKYTYTDNGTFTAPQAVFAVVEQLVQKAGVPASAITIYDAIRYMPDAIYDLIQQSDIRGVHFADYVGGDGREKAERDLNVQVHWSQDLKGNPTYLPTAVTQATYVINMASLKPHNLAGVTLCAKNHFGTIMADWKGQVTLNAPQGANVHGTVAAHAYSWGSEWTWPQAPMGSYNALVDLIGHPHVGAKTLLFFLDGLYVAHDQNANITDDCRWQSAPFNDHWTSSILVSQDNVAIDSVGLDLILAEPTTASLPECLPKGATPDNYLHEAAQADKPPSGTIYKPDGLTVLGSLGVHEHWDNANDKQYSRNLKTGDGIELIKI